MPPKKRTAAEANTGAHAGTRRSKRQSKANDDTENNAEQPPAQPEIEEQQQDKPEQDKDQDNDKDNDKDNKGEDIDKGDPFEYLCFPQPFFDFEAENDDKGEDEDEEEMLDEDEVVDKYNEMIKALPVQGATKFSERAPGHRFFAMRDTIKQRTDLRVRADYSNPDAFGMYVYNDFHGYGIQEVIENILVSFDSEFKKKRTDESLKQMWANIAGLNHWFVQGDIMPWIGCDDGERVNTTVATIGKAILTMFNELDLAGQLKADSDIKDIGLVVSLIMHWANDLPAYGIEEVDWCKDVVAYAKKAGVDLAATGSHTVSKDLESLEEEHGEITALKGAAKADRWGWKKSFKKLKDSYGPLGGDKYNIMKWTRKERAAKAFNKKDPLAKFSDAEIASGDLMLG